MSAEPLDAVIVQIGNSQMRAVQLVRGNMETASAWSGGVLVCDEDNHDHYHNNCHIELNQQDEGISELYPGDWIAKTDKGFKGCPDGMVKKVRNLDDRQAYEVWGIAGFADKVLFASDDPVQVVHWIRQQPVEERYFNVHPTGGQRREFHTDKKLAYEFIRKHKLAVADDIVKRAVDQGFHEGVAQDLFDLFNGR